MNPTEPVEPTVKSTGRRGRSAHLGKRLEASEACFWLIDEDGKVDYLSPAMTQFIGLSGDDSPSETDLQPLLVPDAASWQRRNGGREHQTVLLWIPNRVGSESASSGTSSASMQSVTAHFVRLTPTSHVSGGGSTSDDEAADRVILGFLGDYVSDSDVPWQVWFGEEGVRQHADVQQRIGKFRAERRQLANVLLIGDAAPSRHLRRRVELACRTRFSFGIAGPNGCGSDLIAMLVHQANDTDEAYVRLDASLMDAELLDVYASPVISRLPTPDGDRDSAAHGTLFLERINEMPADAQERLVQWCRTWPDHLRVIGHLCPIVTASPEEPDHSIPVELERPKPRPLADPLSDLLSTFVIDVPSLIERSEDLELMAKAFVSNVRFSRDALQAITAYPWPGQWAEFESAIQFASKIVTGDRIQREHLPLAIRSFRPAKLAKVTISETETVIRQAEKSERDFQIESLDEAVRNYELELIRQAMRAADGNKAEAARRLGISRTRLLRKLESS